MKFLNPEFNPQIPKSHLILSFVQNQREHLLWQCLLSSS